MQLTLEPLARDPSTLASFSNVLCFVSAFRNHNVQFVWLVDCSVFSRPSCAKIRRVPELLTMRFSWRLCTSTNDAGFLEIM